MIALFQPPWWLYLLTRANTEVLNFSAPSFGMASNHALTASLCQAPVSRFYTIILICKGNKSKRRDGMPPPIIMLSYTFYCHGFNTNKMHSLLGVPKRLTSRAQICLKWTFPFLWSASCLRAFI